MSMGMEQMLEWEYFPYYTKEEILEKAKKWVNPEIARDYILKNYDRWKENMDKGKKDFEEMLNQNNV